MSALDKIHAAVEGLREKAAPWMVAWVRDRLERRLEATLGGEPVGPDGKQHLLVAICDHYEPLWSGDGGAPGSASREKGLARVKAWREGYPALAGDFRDADGMPPRHSFFFPGEQYDPDFIEPLGELCEQGYGELEVHLHHDGDTRETLTASLLEALGNYRQHGLVPMLGGKPRWAFIHGNWCLANSRADGRWCGVDDEMEVLHELGCYVDMTFPSAPDPTQPAIVNSIYYPTGDLSKRRAYEAGEPVRVGSPKQRRLLMVQGPLAIALRNGGAGMPIRIDASALTSTDPATASRLATWIAQHVHVRGRPEWTFLKLHTHGAPDAEGASLLGQPQRRFHEELARLGASGRYAVHYVTARELYNIARAAMEGRTGDPGDYRDYEIPAPERALATRARAA